MRLMVRFWVWGGTSARAVVASSKIPLESAQDLPVTGVVDADSPAFDELLAATAKQGGFSWSCFVDVSDEELENSPYFEVSPADYLRQGEAEDSINEYFWRQAAWVSTHPHTEILLPRGALVGPRELHGRSFSGLGHWCCELGCSEEVAEFLRSCKNVGADLLPTQGRAAGKTARTTLQVASRELAPHCLLDETVLIEADSRVLDINGVAVWHRLGLLSYPGYLNLPEFGRTAEPWGGWKYSTWVVGRRLFEMYRENGLKGLRFLPVLEAASPLYEEHRQRLQELVSRLNENAANERYGLWSKKRSSRRLP